MQNQFYKVMNAYSDDELLSVYSNRSKYTPEAIEAMETVISERKLLEAAEQIVVEQEEAEALTKEAQIEKFERSVLGKSISDADFAKEQLDGSVYFQRYVSPVHSYHWLNYLFTLLGGTSLIIAAILIGVGNFSSRYPNLLIVTVILSLLLPYGIWKLSKNKAQLSIIKKMKGNVIVISGSKDQHEIPLPVRYDCFWEWNYIRNGNVKLKQAELFVILYDDQKDTCYAFAQVIEIHKTPPPHWEKLPKNFDPQKSHHFTYKHYGFQKPFLYEFQKVLSGLNQEK